MKASIRRFHSPDIPDLSAYSPEDPTVFAFVLQVLAGPRNEQGEESFDIVVCSTGWLATHLGEDEIRSGRHHLIVKQYDWATLERYVKEQFEAVEGDTWREVASVLGRFGRWEFEDYVD